MTDNTPTRHLRLVPDAPDDRPDGEPGPLPDGERGHDILHARAEPSALRFFRGGVTALCGQATEHLRTRRDTPEAFRWAPTLIVRDRARAARPYGALAGAGCDSEPVAPGDGNTAAGAYTRTRAAPKNVRFKTFGRARRAPAIRKETPGADVSPPTGPV